MNELDLIREVIHETLGIEKESIKPEDSIENLCRDSIQIFSLIMAFEKRFETKVDYANLVKIETVQDIADFLRKNVK